MPRNVIYRITQRGPRHETRWIDILPADGTPLPADPTIIDVPSAAVVLGQQGEDAFKDQLAIGMQQTGTMPMQIRSWELSASADLQDLRGYLNDFDTETGTLHRSDGTRDLALSNVIRIRTNAGVGGDPTLVEFEGVQGRNPESKGSIHVGRGFECEYVLTDAISWVAEKITMADVCQHLLGQTMSAPWGWDTWHERVFEWLYELINGTGTRFRYAWVHADYWTAYHQLIKLFEAVESLLDDAYKVLTRQAYDDPARVRLRTWQADSGGMPWDMWRFKARSHTGWTAYQADRTLDREELGIQSGIRVDMDTAPFAGLCLDGSDSLYTFGTAGAFLATACEAAWVRGRIDRSTVGAVDIWMEGWLGEGDADQLALTDFRFGRSEAPIIPCTLGGKVVEAIGVDLRGAQGKDLRTVRWPASGSSTKSSAYTVPAIWDNAPTVAEADWWELRFGADVILLPGIDDVGIMHAAASRMWPWKLTYFGSPLGTSATVPLVVHPSCEYRDGTAYQSTTGFEVLLPAPASPTFESFIAPWRVINAGLQSSNGMSALLIDEVRLMLAQPKQAFYQGTHDTGRISSSAVGRKFSLPLGPGDVPTAAGLLATGETWLDYPGRCVLTSRKRDPKTGKVQCVYHGLRNY
ncbi:MAG TPA: hypothetical protein VHI13_05120 [Candidatus Kapabacteria bacterium]|nr:hypothetical protein [Candidatus Kapabacteria bacterium]